MIDGADEREIRRSMRVGKDDATLRSWRMKRTIQRLRANLRAPHTHWPEVRMRDDLTSEGDLTNDLVLEDLQGIAWNRRHSASLELQLGRLLWSDVAVALIGQNVPPSVAALSLQARLTLYCLLVQGCTQDETRQIMRCTDGEIDRSLRDGLRAVGGVRTNLSIDVSGVTMTWSAPTTRLVSEGLRGTSVQTALKSSAPLLTGKTMPNP
jgi:hypothetical protein